MLTIFLLSKTLAWNTNSKPTDSLTLYSLLLYRVHQNWNTFSVLCSFKYVLFYIIITTIRLYTIYYFIKFTALYIDLFKTYIPFGTMCRMYISKQRLASYIVSKIPTFIYFLLYINIKLHLFYFFASLLCPPLLVFWCCLSCFLLLPLGFIFSMPLEDENYGFCLTEFSVPVPI